MSLDRLFNPLRLNADVTLRDGGGAVPQKPLDELSQETNRSRNERINLLPESAVEIVKAEE